MPETPTQEDQKISEPQAKIDPFANSPLGQDPTPAPVEPQEPPPAAEVVPPTPEGVTITQAEHDSLIEKARNYDVVTADDKAVAMLRDHFNGEVMNTPNATPTPPADESDYGRQIGELKTLIENLAGTVEGNQEQLAVMTVSAFAKDNPNFETHRVKIGEIMGQHRGMSLERALRLAIAEAGPSEPASPGERKDVAIRPTVETSGNSEIPGAGNSLEEAERLIADTTKVPDFDAACKLALKASLEHHGVKGG